MPNVSSAPASIEQFLSAVSTASAKDTVALRTQALAWLEVVRRSKHVDAIADYSRASKGVYDKWVLDLFTLADTVTPVNALLKGFVDRFAEVHQVVPGRGPWALVMEGYPPHGGSPWHFKLVTHTGLTDSQIKQFAHANLSGNAFLTHVFTPDTVPVDLWYLPYYRDTQDADQLQAQPFEAGLFDAFFGHRQVNGVAVSGNAWITAQPLADHTGRIAHVVFLLYPNRGGLFEVANPPSGAPLDRRVLDILVPVYKQLSGQMHRLADLVDFMKRDIVAQIGMGLINHEIGGVARVLQGSVRNQAKLVALIEERYGDLPPEMELLKSMLATQLQHALQLDKTTHAFNNLERRGQVNEFALQDVFDEVDSLTRVRRGEVGVGLRTHADGVRLHNDATLLLHALLNLVINALNAIEEAQPPCAFRQIELRAGTLTPELLWIEIANTGPPIAPDIRSRLFQRGATSRPHGHGQGLYLVRQIAQYCGGDATCPDAQPPEIVVFRLTVARHLNTDTQLGLLANPSL